MACRWFRAYGLLRQWALGRAGANPGSGLADLLDHAPAKRLLDQIGPGQRGTGARAGTRGVGR